MKKARGIGWKVRAHRLNIGMSQRQLLRYLGLGDIGIISMIETGTREPSPRQRALLQSFLAAPPEALKVKVAMTKPGRDTRK